MKKNINPTQLAKSTFQKFFGKRETKQSVVFDIAEIGLKLDQCKCYPWGENLLRVIDEDGDGRCRHGIRLTHGVRCKKLG